jgi:hypothetical protein
VEKGPDGHSDRAPEFLCGDGRTFQKDNHLCNTPPIRSLFLSGQMDIEHNWRDLKIAMQQRSSSNLTELERIYREEWEKLPR